MLTRLSVSNFAIIDKLQLQFSDGLTIITGETGAGKSILLGALKLILGERADLKQLNDQSKKCIIEASFNISNLNLVKFFEKNDLDYETETILRRELLSSGKSRAFVNDTPVTLNILQELGESLIDIHSQFNSENILHQNYQILILDAYAEQISTLKNYQLIYSNHLQKVSELKNHKKQLEDSSKEADYKQFLVDELGNADLRSNELLELETEQKELQNVDEIQRVLFEIENKFDATEFGILSQLQESSNRLQKIAEFGDELGKLGQRLVSTKIELDDIRNEISAKIQHLESNPQRLLEINERLDLIHGLLTKHHANSIEELLKIQESLENEKSNFQQLEQKITHLENELLESEKQLISKSNALSKGRKSIISQVEKELLASVSKLGMENATLKIEVRPKSDFSFNGKDEIDFLFSANKGVGLKKIGKSVSGGERSRLMLAIKKMMAGKLDLPTLILDEIDTGVSGKVANEVGNLMKEMANDLQLISITHLPQVASKAKQHFKVQKQASNNQTLTEVVLLNDEQRISEIASLISGSNVTETALSQAKELISS
ncbi:MAG: DNA repair protein RecN [Moheibacter sp.]